MEGRRGGGGRGTAGPSWPLMVSFTEKVMEENGCFDVPLRWENNGRSRLFSLGCSVGTGRAGSCLCARGSRRRELGTRTSRARAASVGGAWARCRRSVAGVRGCAIAGRGVATESEGEKREGGRERARRRRLEDEQGAR
jgi:hypothetical protein